MTQPATAIDWGFLEINRDGLEESWSRKPAREGFLTSLESKSLRTITDICEVVGIAVAKDADKHALVQKVIQAGHDKDLFYAKAFLRGKSPALQEYLFSQGSDLFKRLRGLAALASTIALARDSLDHLVLIEILARWIVRPAGAQYEMAKEFSDDLGDTLSKQLPDLAERLKTKSAELGRGAQPDTIYRVGDLALLGIDRQTGDRLVREVGGRRRSRPSSLGLVRFRTGSTSFEFRNMGPFDDIVLNWIRSEVGTVVKTDPGMFDEFQKDELHQCLLTPLGVIGEQRVPVTRLAARTSLTIGQSQIQLQSQDQRSDIRADLQNLVNDNLIRLDEPSDIDSLELVFDGRQIKVSVRTDSDEFACRAVPEDAHLTDEQRRRLVDVFRSSVGFPLDVPVARGDTPINRSWAFDRLLSEGAAVMDPRAASFRQDLVGLGAADEEEVFRWKCDEGHFDTAAAPPAVCSHCGSDEIKTVVDVQVRVNHEELEKLVLESIAAIPGVSVRSNVVQRTISGQKHFLRVIDVDGQVAYVYFAYSSVGVAFLRFFTRATTTLLIVRVGLDGTTSRRLQDSLYAEVSAGEILEATLAKKAAAVPIEVQRRVQTMHRTAHELRLRATRLSANNLRSALANPEKSYKTDFEVDVFNLFTWWMDIAERWGANAVGKAVPEGVGAWTAGVPDASPFSVAWDCKWAADGNKFDLSSTEKRKASDYIARLREQPHFKVFSGDLSGYAVICNNFAENQLEALALKCISDNDTWAGRVLFIDGDAVLRLFELFVDNHGELEKRVAHLRDEMTKLLFSGTTRWCRVTSADVEACIERTLVLPVPPTLDVKGLRLLLN